MFFRNEAHLTFPPQLRDRLFRPFGEPIAYFDSMSARRHDVPGTPFTHGMMLPPNPFQYHGLYFALVTRCRTLLRISNLPPPWRKQQPCRDGGRPFFSDSAAFPHADARWTSHSHQSNGCFWQHLTDFFAATPRVSKPRSIEIRNFVLFGRRHSSIFDLHWSSPDIEDAANLRALLNDRTR